MNAFYSLLFIALLLSGCGATGSALSTYQASFNFSNINTYSTFERNSSLAQLQSMSDVTRNSIELRIEQALDNKGLQFESSEQADVLVTYHLIDDYRELARYNQSLQYCRGCLHSAKSVQTNKKLALHAGSLILDVVDNRKHRSVWRSVYPLGIKRDDDSRDVDEKIKLAIHSMLASMPIGFADQVSRR